MKKIVLFFFALLVMSPAAGTANETKSMCLLSTQGLRCIGQLSFDVSTDRCRDRCQQLGASCCSYSFESGAVLCNYNQDDQSVYDTNYNGWFCKANTSASDGRSTPSLD